MDNLSNKGVLCALFSSAFYWAWLFLLYWSSSLIADPTISFNAKGCGLVGSALALGVWFLLMRSGKGKLVDAKASMAIPFALSPLAGISSLACALPNIAPLPSALHYTLWLLSGFGAAIVLVHMSYGVYKIKSDGAFLILALSTLLSCSIATFTCMLPSQSLPVSLIVIALPLASYGLAILGERLPADETQRAAGKQEPPKQDEIEASGNLGPSPSRKIPRRAFLMPLLQMLCYSITFSFALFIGLNGSQQGMPSEYIWFGALLSGVLILLYGLWLKEKMTIGLVQYILFGIAAVGLAPLAIADQLHVDLRFASCTLLMLSFTSFDMLSMNQLLAMIDEYRISYPRYFALGRLGNAAGMFAGWALAKGVIVLDAVFPSWNLTRVLPIAMIVVLVFVVMAFSYDSIKTADDKPERTAESVQATWKTACGDLCEKYGLSPRESEVFALYAKGRDTAFICDELCVSNHTVRTHIYHIYGKTGIHSQQDLISAVENRVLEMRTEKR